MFWYQNYPGQRFPPLSPSVNAYDQQLLAQLQQHHLQLPTTAYSNIQAPPHVAASNVSAAWEVLLQNIQATQAPSTAYQPAQQLATLLQGNRGLAHPPAANATIHPSQYPVSTRSPTSSQPAYYAPTTSGEQPYAVPTPAQPSISATATLNPSPAEPYALSQEVEAVLRAYAMQHGVPFSTATPLAATYPSVAVPPITPRPNPPSPRADWLSDALTAYLVVAVCQKAGIAAAAPAAYSTLTAAAHSSAAAASLPSAPIAANAASAAAPNTSTAVGHSYVAQESQQPEAQPGLTSLHKRPRPSEPAVRSLPECVLCLSEPKCMMCTPCNHVVYCEDCAESVSNKSCPLCRKKSRRLVKIFL